MWFILFICLQIFTRIYLLNSFLLNCLNFCFFRIRITGCGIHDVVNYDGGKNVTHYQHEDLLMLGHLLVCLACRSTSSVQNIPKSLEFISSHYSPDFKQLLVFLLTKPTSLHSPTVDDVLAMIAPRVMDEADNLYKYAELLTLSFTIPTRTHTHTHTPKLTHTNSLTH